VENERDDGDNEQDMNQTGCHVKYTPSQWPSDKQHNKENSENAHISPSARLPDPLFGEGVREVPLFL